jgi:hypothetical protein
MKRLKIILFGLLALGGGSFTANLGMHFPKTTTGEARAQPAPTATPTFTPAFTVQNVGGVTAFLSKSASSTGVAVVVTNNSTGASSMNFYFQCFPGTKLEGTLGVCPENGIFVSSQIICEGANAQSCSN